MYSVSSYYWTNAPRNATSSINRVPPTGTTGTVQGAMITSQQPYPKQYLVHYGQQSATFAPTPYGNTSGVYRRTAPVCITCR
jgi:hypothetical protein